MPNTCVVPHAPGLSSNFTNTRIILLIPDLPSTQKFLDARVISVVRNLPPTIYPQPTKTITFPVVLDLLLPTPASFLSSQAYSPLTAYR